ncbi:MAG: restriction endonuclease subunit S [Balneolaceae bacterium]
MKDSGIEWIGEIPEKWNTLPLKRVVKEPLMYGANEAANDSNPEDPRYLRITDFDKSGNLRDNTYKSLPFEKAKDYLLEEGDILFARSGATVGKTFQFKNYKKLACFAGYLIKATPSNNILSDFLYFYTKSGSYNDWKGSIFNQATIQNIGADKYNLLPVPTPPLPEQTQIVSFLDDKTAKIDSLIEKKQRKIELLREKRKALINHAVTKGLNPDAPMKDSGVEWLGEIPEEWKVTRMKYLSDIETGSRDTQDQEPSGEYPFFVRSETVEKINSFSFDREAILTAGDGVGVCKVFHHYAGRFEAHQRVYVLSNFKSVNGRFLFYYIRENFIKEVKKLSAKSTVDSLRRHMFQNFPVSLCSFEEQSQIVSYLDKQTSEIDQLITKEDKKIELLKEYRQSLISEAVTGKIDVRGYTKANSEVEKEAVA